MIILSYKLVQFTRSLLSPSEAKIVIALFNCRLLFYSKCFVVVFKNSSKREDYHSAITLCIFHKSTSSSESCRPAILKILPPYAFWNFRRICTAMMSNYKF